MKEFDLLFLRTFGYLCKIICTHETFRDVNKVVAAKIDSEIDATYHLCI